MFISGLFGSNNNSSNTRCSCGSVVMCCAVVVHDLKFPFLLSHRLPVFVRVGFGVRGSELGWNKDTTAAQQSSTSVCWHACACRGARACVSEV